MRCFLFAPPEDDELPRFICRCASVASEGVSLDKEGARARSTAARLRKDIPDLMRLMPVLNLSLSSRAEYEIWLSVPLKV